jgi:hypothetical protein
MLNERGSASGARVVSVRGDIQTANGAAGSLTRRGRSGAPVRSAAPEWSRAVSLYLQPSFHENSAKIGGGHYA